MTEETIRKFFEGKCDAREGARVEAWLKENPARLKELLGAEEWEDFRPLQHLSPDVSGKLWNAVKKNTGSPAKRLAFPRWIAVAASLLLAIALTWQFVLRKSSPVNAGGDPVATFKKVVNTTTQKMALELSDGSTVELLPGSTLSYPENFPSANRSVLLTGVATFDVAKDPARPFSVQSDNLLINVLGTRFTVNTDEADSAAKVILHEGKVLVKVADPATHEHKKEYYLSAGDIFVCRKTDRRAPATRILPLARDPDDHYSFDNYPLDVVFDQLQMIYHTKINYHKADLGNRSFIGKTDKKDPLEHILKSITLLTNLSLHKDGDGFVIGPASRPN